MWKHFGSKVDIDTQRGKEKKLENEGIVYYLTNIIAYNHSLVVLYFTESLYTQLGFVVCFFFHTAHYRCVMSRYSQWRSR